MNRTGHSALRARSGGFSLLELMIAITIVGIVTAAAIATYGDSMVKTRRGTAQACLMEAAQFMERNYTLNMTYAVAYPNLACVQDLADFYDFAFEGVPDGDSYEVEATPTGSQLDDNICGTMSIDQAGTKTATDVEACW
ncbi:MAG: prepilin-type N-terminal cleavage/methylation domain-containing protein [Pseudomonadota bacterium]|nr:prepilin-type N-terminal cleavage/methylation domain-containing protein [Pseudomonadota bacterium]